MNTLPWIDSHAHLTSDAIYPQIEAVLSCAQSAGVTRLVNICTDATTLERGIQLSERYPWVYNVAATTPHDVEEEGASFFPLVEEAVKKGRLVAIGETGLDFHYAHSAKEVQSVFLLRYFALALSSQLPLVFHCREAFASLFSLAEEHYKSPRALLHCFTGTLDEAREVLDRGWYLSLSGIVTFKKSEQLREIARFVPLDRLMLETDAPYLAPQSRRGQQNEPAFMVETARFVADLKGVSLETLSEQLAQNASNFFAFQKLK